MTARLVVVGNGMAAGRMLEHLVAAAPAAFAVTVFNAEPRVNYDRILLSPVLAGEKHYPDIVIHDDAWYARHDITLRKACPVTAIDRAARTVTGADGSVTPYDVLVLATGSSPIVLPVPGHDLPGVIAYRDLDDVAAMIAAAESGGRAVVIGGGLLGLEAAAGLRARGMAVTVVHLMPTLMERQLDPAAGRLLERAIRGRGIAVVTGATTAAILGDRHVTGVRLADGRDLPADLVVMAVGIRPHAALAKAAGLAVARGIQVDDGLATSDRDIFALGECVEHRGQCYGLVAPLYEMAAVLAARLAGDTTAAYRGSVTATRLKVTGIDLYSAGDFAATPGRDAIVLQHNAAGTYQRLVLEGDRIVGVVLYGDVADGGWFFELLREGRSVAALRDTLIFGRRFVDTARPDPLESVAAGPAMSAPATEAAQ